MGTPARENLSTFHVCGLIGPAPSLVVHYSSAHFSLSISPGGGLRMLLRSRTLPPTPPTSSLLVAASPSSVSH